MGNQPLNELAIFRIAFRIESDEVREDYLRQACGNDQILYARVTAILKANTDSQKFLEPPPDQICATIDNPSLAERPGTQIGPYKLYQEIGEGGMGVVYMALQKEPVRRKVALKIIKPGMDTWEVIARFAAEQQALAMMDHPNIARVIDAGTTETGRPYFVMELVNGVPITQYCDDNNSTTEQRLELFTLVCHAVQHAHQKGIIHRDIKPSNILVTLHDGVPVPKVIDFGIAKAIHQELTSKTMATGVGHMIGTPLYMSPEQAERSGLDIDTRSDVYSLGVLLYELLTGSTPFDSDQFKDVGLDEVRRLIREQEPPRPSTRISTMGKAATTASEHRRTSPVELSNSLRHELDWIVMKALEKDRTRRYESANDFARDVQRYLHDEPVEACPPSRVYRLRKFVRRNRLITAVSLIAVFGIVVAFGVSSYLSVVSRDAAEARSALAEQRLRIQQQCSDILGEVIQLKETANEAHQQKIDVSPTRDKLQLAIALAESNSVESGLMAQLRAIDGDLARNERDRKLLSALDQAWSSAAYTDVDTLPFVGRGRNRRVSLVRSALTDFGIRTGVPFNADAGVADQVRSILRDSSPAVRDAVFASLNECLAYTPIDFAVFQPNVPKSASEPKRFEHPLLGVVRLGCDLDGIVGQIRALAQTALNNMSADARGAKAARIDLIRPGEDKPFTCIVIWWNFTDAWITELLESEDRDAWRKSFRESLFIPESQSRIARWQELANAPEAINQPVPFATQLASGLESSADAIRLLKSVQERHPDDVGASVCLAEKLMASNPPQVAEAVRFYTAAVAVRPSNSSLNAKLAVALQRMERPDEAHAAIHRATEQGSDKAAAYFAAGCALLVPEFVDEAIEQFRNAASFAPQNAAVRNNLGVALHRAGKYSDAAVEFREAIRLRPNWAVSHCNLGTALKDAGEMEQAMAAYAKAIEVDPMCSEARWNMFFAKQSPSSTRPEQTQGDHAFGTNTIVTLDFEQADNPGPRPDFLTGLTIAQQVEAFLFRYTTWIVLSRDDAANLVLSPKQ